MIGDFYKSCFNLFFDCEKDNLIKDIQGKTSFDKTIT